MPPTQSIYPNEHRVAFGGNNEKSGSLERIMRTQGSSVVVIMRNQGLWKEIKGNFNIVRGRNSSEIKEFPVNTTFQSLHTVEKNT